MAAIKSYKDQTDLERLDVTGNVRQVMQACYKAHFKAGKIIMGDIENEPPDRNPNLLETFNEKGYHTESVQYRHYGNQKNIYDDNRHVIRSIHYRDKNTITSINTYTYDEKGNFVEALYLKPDGTVSSRSVHTYDSENHKISEYTYHGPEQVLYNYSLFKYSDKGLMLGYTKYKANGDVEYSHEKKFDDKGFLIEDLSLWTEERMAKSSTRGVYKNNEHGDCIEHTVYEMDGTVKYSYSYTYQYDSEGKKILPPREIIELYPKAPEETEEFEYDARGNWVKKTVCYKKAPSYIVIREIAYADEVPVKTLVHPLENIVKDGSSNVYSFKQEELVEPEVRFLAESNLTADQFPLVRYYTLFYKEFPSSTTYSSAYVEVEYLLERLRKEMGAKMLHSASNVYDAYGARMLRYTLFFPNYSGYLLHVNNISTHHADDFDVPSYMNTSRFDTLATGQILFLKPSETYGHADEYFEDEISNHIQACTVEKKPEKPVINIIEVSNNSFVIREHSVDDDFEIKDLEINYGYGFLKFHEDLLQRFSTKTKGLVLFHGEPGTGKTYYIRHLLRAMVKRKKEVIYMPPNMVDHLADPAFMTFLTQTVKNWSQNGNFCLLLIEDAEPLLARRQEGVRIQGITNLLNMSDGILNDLLNVQIICTFNVSVKKLDSALLRPGRLIARKEFKALSVIDANRLAQRIGVKHHFTEPATLGEIYALQKDSNTLVHDVDHDEGSSERIDDLV